MCHTIGCACLGRLHSAVTAPSGGRFSVLPPVYSRHPVGSFLDRFQGLWPHPTDNDWPTSLQFPPGTAPPDAPMDRHHPEPHQDIDQVDAQTIALFNSSAYSNSIPTTAMKFSGKDLEDIQRVAGLLNLTVDELLQQSRDYTHRDTTVTSPPQPGPSFAPDAQVQLAEHQAPLGLDSDTFDVEVPRSSHESTEQIGLSPSLPAQHSGTEVILLNPQGPWYDCDASLWDFDGSFSASPALVGSNYPDTDATSSYVPVEPMQLDSGSISEQTAQEGSQMGSKEDASTDWYLVSPPHAHAFETPASPSTGSTDKRYHSIAPRSAKSSTQPTSENSSFRVKKKRSPYEGTKKTDTHLTRQLHACVRCRMQRNRVSDRLAKSSFSYWLTYQPSIATSAFLIQQTPEVLV